MKGFIKRCIPERMVFLRETFRDYPYRTYMDRHKCIFIHIPKAAGTSIINALAHKRLPRDHCSYHIYRQASKKKFENYFKFCFVRHPYTRILSVFNYLKNGGNKRSDLKLQETLLDKYPTFDKFVVEFLNKDIIHQILLLKPQYTFVCNHDFKLMVDFCGRFESIDKDFFLVCERLGIKKNLPKLNVSKANSKSFGYEDIGRPVIEKLNYLYEKDFEVFKYNYR